MTPSRGYVKNIHKRSRATRQDETMLPYMTEGGDLA